MKFATIFATLLISSSYCFNSVFAAGLPTPSAVKFCKNSRLAPADGTQIANGFCSSLIQGEIPSSSKMTSTIILFPKNEKKVRANKPFTAEVKISNLETGHFSDPKVDYYDIPQKLNNRGIIRGHSHITIQKIGSGEEPLNAAAPTFFKGLNERADRKGVLTTDVDPLPRGYYRMCTMAAAESHQPVISAIAKRGSQDDCIRFYAV